MKISIYKEGGRLGGGYTIPGITLTGPLLLSGEMSSPSEAINKQYVDKAVADLNASSVTTGTISAARLPAFTGDVTSTQGSSVLNLSTTGVVAGDYAKITVNSKGRVTAGGSLIESDIPNLSWGKITSDKPTTATGYGITGAVEVGGLVTGFLTLSGDPTTAKGAVTKQYVDALMSGASGLVSGDIINRTASTTPDGFLRLNGGELSKTTYSALYNVLGDTFNYTTTPGSGQPWRQQYQINLEPSGDITGWTTGTFLPGALGVSQAIVTKNRVYLLGGQTSSSYTNIVYTAPINADGTLGTWTSGTSLPAAIGYSHVIVTKNRVYLLGGYDGTGGITSTVYTAPINTDGTLGTWTTGTPLPAAVSHSQAVVTKNRVYLLGGVGSNTVYTAPVNADGTLGTWTTATPLPASIYGSQAIVTKNRVYLLGGANNGAHSSTVYTAPINSDGTLGAWTTGTSLPGILHYSHTIVTKNRVYLLGGYNGSSYVNTVYTAPINADGTLGTWTTGTSLPAALNYSQAIVTKNRVYLLGGYISSTVISTVYTAPFSGGFVDYSPYYDGSLQPTDPANFRLPDYTPYETTELYFFIKT